ncbi:MAG: chitobiase/beta-hexosaminidase C-terminal domain-containing protein [Chitinispirillaceae bacterium]|nr:chitobiase/beta-hexosaminidase C-terminal domain-containing protein [Chitinispirillaceae bacterium]
MRTARQAALFSRRSPLMAAAFVVAAFALSSPGSAPQKKPAAIPPWLDTVPPMVEILPAKTWHSSIFMITLSANERARFWVGVNNRRELAEYVKPITMARDTAITVYYYGEDDYGNRSPLDSMRYVLDRRPPQLRFIPEPGSYEKGVVVYFAADKPCRFEYLKDPTSTKGKAVPESLAVAGVFEGHVAAIDSAGNRVVSPFFRYIVDTTSIQVSVQPAGGLFREQPKIVFDASRNTTVFFTFDPLAPPDLFSEYRGVIRLPHGLSTLRYYGKNGPGRRSAVQREKFILDTIPPRLQVQPADGAAFDRLSLSIKEPGEIRYTLDGSIPDKKSARYEKEIVIPHKGMCRLRAFAWDEAGNRSDLLEWDRKYDFAPPLVVMTPAGGVFTRALTAFVSVNEKADMYYTIDGSEPGTGSILYNNAGISISREGATVVRYFGVDEAGNRSEEHTVTFLLDTRPPQVRVRIEGSLLLKNFQVRLTANEPSVIYYEVDGKKPTTASRVYSAPIPLESGQALMYMARDSAGNVSSIYEMDELKKPMVSPSPEAGMYNRRVSVRFVTNITGIVYCRMPPDTSFRPFRDSIVLNNEGSHSIEYYLESQQGLKSPLRRSEYYLDWTPPRVGISVKKGFADSVSVFFECSENASVYYTTDGSNPLYSRKTMIAGNKLTMARDRISLLRSAEAKLAFYAEDAAGNQGAMTVLDVFKPRVIPNVPAGSDRLYDRILSVTLNTYDQSTIYYARHGRPPTADSAVYAVPLTLIASDTIVAFAVDASGFRGDPDTLVYLIDLPPSAHFSVSPDTIYEGVQAVFDASTSVDKEHPLSRLTFRWDFDGDGRFDAGPFSDPRIAHRYEKPGSYEPLLEVSDPNKRSGVLSRTLRIHERCPSGMVSVVDTAGRSFCIDRYEWPNRHGRLPRTSVSWVEAKMACIDAGKRLCTQQEWEAVCRAGLPYAKSRDREERCQGVAKGPGRAGSGKKCAGAGVYDMIGNVGEWVEDRRGDYPYAMGGTWRDGRDAHCGHRVPGTIATRSEDTGFRCCK